MAGQPDEGSTLSQVGQSLGGKYRLVRELGRGGFGVVFEGLHLRLRRRVAVKMLLPRALTNPRLLVRFDREARHAAQLQSPHAVRILDIDTTPEGLPYLVMEYLEGRPLDEELRRRGALPAEEAVRYVMQACEALAEAHALGIVHRDIKPANLFLARTPEGQMALKVLDFGISKDTSESESSITQSQISLGTPLYMSPEQVRSSKNVDPRTDVWSLGVVLFELLAGQAPFAGDTATAVAAAIIADPLPSLGSLRPGLPPPLLDAIERALTKDREQRFASISAFADALRPIAARSLSLPPATDPLAETAPHGDLSPGPGAGTRVSIRPPGAHPSHPSGLDATAPRGLGLDATAPRPSAPGAAGPRSSGLDATAPRPSGAGVSASQRRVSSSSAETEEADAQQASPQNTTFQATSPTMPAPAAARVGARHAALALALVGAAAGGWLLARSSSTSASGPVTASPQASVSAASATTTAPTATETGAKAATGQTTATAATASATAPAPGTGSGAATATATGGLKAGAEGGAPPGPGKKSPDKATAAPSVAAATAAATATAAAAAATTPAAPIKQEPPRTLEPTEARPPRTLEPSK